MLFEIDDGVVFGERLSGKLQNELIFHSHGKAKLSILNSVSQWGGSKKVRSAPERGQPVREILFFDRVSRTAVRAPELWFVRSSFRVSLRSGCSGQPRLRQ